MCLPSFTEYDPFFLEWGGSLASIDGSQVVHRFSSGIQSLKKNEGRNKYAVNLETP